MNRYLLWGAFSILWCPLSAVAQQQIPQVVQLPTFQVFSVGTTVVVPDSGRGFVGGVRTSRRASSTFGAPGVSHLPWLTRMRTDLSRSAESRSAAASVTATIHDPAEHDKAFRLGSGDSAKPDKSATLTGVVSGAATDVRTLGSVREIRERKAAAAARQYAEWASQLEQGRRAEAAGRLGAARCVYEALIRQASGKVQAEARDRLASLTLRVENKK